MVHIKPSFRASSVVHSAATADLATIVHSLVFAHDCALLFVMDPAAVRVGQWI